MIEKYLVLELPGEKPGTREYWKLYWGKGDFIERHARLEIEFIGGERNSPIVQRFGLVPRRKRTGQIISSVLLKDGYLRAHQEFIQLQPESGSDQSRLRLALSSIQGWRMLSSQEFSELPKPAPEPSSTAVAA